MASNPPTPAPSPAPPHPPGSGLSKKVRNELAKGEQNFSHTARGWIVALGAVLVAAAIVLGFLAVPLADETTKTIRSLAPSRETTTIYRGGKTSKKYTMPASTEETIEVTKASPFRSSETLLALVGLGVALMLAGALRIKSLDFPGGKLEAFDSAEFFKGLGAAMGPTNLPPDKAETVMLATFAEASLESDEITADKVAEIASRNIQRVTGR